MERHDDHPVSKNPGTVKIPFYDSIQYRILLLVILPVLFGLVSIGILVNISIRSVSGIQNISEVQTGLYQNLSLPEQLNYKLTTYLNTENEEDLSEYVRMRQDFMTFLDDIELSSQDSVYLQSLRSMGQELIEQADFAAASLNFESEMLAAAQNVDQIQQLITAISPYVTRESDTVSSNRITAVTGNFYKSIRITVFILIAILVLLIVIAVRTAQTIIGPLRILTDSVQNISLTETAPIDEPVRARGELGILVASYKDMLQRLHDQWIELEEKRNVEKMLQAEKEKHLVTEAQLTRSELNVYQSQINSHFLFNAFNTVSRLAYLENAPQVQHSVNLIAQFIRDIMTQFDRTVTVAEEFSIAKNYIEIQNLRFGDRIQVECSLDPDVEWFTLPALSLQPLVENAYGHGLSGRMGGFIRCVAEPEGDYLKIYVWDDGEGIPVERQERIRQFIEKNGTEHLNDCIALRNIYRRLDLLYPGKVRLELESIPGEYTRLGFSIFMK